MTRLLSAGFARLMKNKLFWFGNLLLTGFFVFLLFLYSWEAKQHPDYIRYNSDYLLFASFQIIGIFASCFTGMFLGTEYSDGTLRNKLIAGRSRTQVYLSNMILSFAASLFASLLSILVNCVLGIALFGPLEQSLSQILQYLVLGILMLAAFAGIFTLIAMLIPSRSAGSVICIMLFFLMLIAATYILSRLDQPEFIPSGYTIVIDNVLQPKEQMTNPYYLQGVKRDIFEFFRDLLPTSQGSMLMAQEVARPLVQAACSLGLMILTTISGIYHFKKKDLK